MTTTQDGSPAGTAPAGNAAGAPGAIAPPASPPVAPPTPTTSTTAATAAPASATAHDGALDPDDLELGVQADGDVVMMPRAAFKKFKERTRARGQRGAADELDQQARAAGFAGGVRDAFAAIARIGAQPPHPAPPPAPAQPARPEEIPMARRLDDKERARRRATKQSQAAALALKDQEIARLKAEQGLARADAAALVAETAMRARLGALGVQDAEFGAHLVKPALAGKTAAEIRAFVEGGGLATWVDEQKKARPALFAPVVQPATTAPAAATGASAPGTPPVGAPPAPGTPPAQSPQGDTLAHNLAAPRAEIDAKVALLKRASRQQNASGGQ